MVLIRYSQDDLLKLRNSPLVRKPDNMPSIEQWLDPPQSDSGLRTKGRPSTGRAEDSEGIDGSHVRPSLGTRLSTRNTSTSLEDVVLGPPKLAFTSNTRGQNKGSEGGSAAFASHNGRHDRASLGRSSRDIESSRSHARNGPGGALEPERDDEGWTDVKPRRSFGTEEGERWQRNNERDRERNRNPTVKDGDRIGEARRTGVGRGRFDKPWTREEMQGPTRDQDTRGSGSGRAGGWRDRVDRDERDWNRGGKYDRKGDEMPEWMDESKTDPTTEDTDPSHTAENFERWKAAQKAGKSQTLDKAEVDAALRAPVESSTNLKSPDAAAAKEGKLFGMWADADKVKADEQASAAKKPQAKAKSSKFAGFFGAQKSETPIEPQSAASPPPGAASANEEDKAGFNKILQMLSNSNVSSPPPSAMQARSPSGFAGQTAEDNRIDSRRLQEFPEDNPYFPSERRNVPSAGAPFEQRQQGVPQTVDRHINTTQEYEPQRQEQVANSLSRNGSSATKNFNVSGPEPQKMDPNQTFLLNLMNSHHGNSKRAGLPSSDLNSNFVFPDNKASRQPGLPQVRSPLPGFSDDPGALDQQIPMGREFDGPGLSRKTSQHNAGFPARQPIVYDDPAIAELQRRNSGRTSLPPHLQHSGQPVPVQGMPRHYMPPMQDDMLPKGFQGPPPGMPRPMGPHDGLPNMQQGLRLPPGFGGAPPGFHQNMPGHMGVQSPTAPPGLHGHFPRGPNPMGGVGGPSSGLPPNYFGNGLSPAGPLPPQGFDPRMAGPMGMPPGLNMPGGSNRMLSPDEMMMIMQQQQRGGAGGRMQ